MCRLSRARGCYEGTRQTGRSECNPNRALWGNLGLAEVSRDLYRYQNRVLHLGEARVSP